MSSTVGLFVEFLEDTVSFEDQVDEDDDHNADNGETGHDDQSHFPSHNEGNDGTTEEHTHQIEHATYFLACCFLVGETVSVELGWEFELVFEVKPAYVLSEKALHIGFATFDGHSFTEDGPAGEGDPGSDQCSNADVEEDVSIMFGIIDSLLSAVGIQESIQNFAPEIGEPWETASSDHGEDDAQD